VGRKAAHYGKPEHHARLIPVAYPIRKSDHGHPISIAKIIYQAILIYLFAGCQPGGILIRALYEVSYSIAGIVPLGLHWDEHQLIQFFRFLFWHIPNVD
jgi:hypothetical protein